MERKEAVDRAAKILILSNVAPDIITGQRKVTVAQIANLLKKVSDDQLRIPADAIEDMFQGLAQTKPHSKADALSLVDAILRADSRFKAGQ
jgi:hypothetical protein